MTYASSDFYLSKAALSRPEISPVEGHSGYFSTPESGLDPNLFIGDQLRTDVAAHIRQELYSFWLGRYRNPHSWSRLWLAGSGISYQWAGDRGNGDLDVMIGISADDFRDSNPIYAALSNAELADHINSELRAWLWPTTAHTQIGAGVYEVTYYWNAAATADPYGVENIHPYAAYDLMSLTWRVRPPRLPADPRTLYPADWWEQIDREAETARGIISRYNKASQRAATMQSGSPGHVSALTEVRLATSQAAALFEDIHKGRQAAFGPGGKGYSDWANFRWQAHKASGIGPALADIANVSRSAMAEASTALYGGPVKDANSALTDALMWTRARGIK
ncbi:hypothetical protein AB0K16_22280 [Nonomuraea jabiensis]|uniref:hypothetical protein n=1 Tax=Nonomuraea jabiensis TaxID=882448 RepID=UPI00342E3981